MIKICLIIHSISIGGMERVMSQLASHFSEKDQTKVDLVLIGRKREVLFSLPSNITIHRPSFTFQNKRRAFDTLRTILFLRKKVKELEPDTILSFGEYWNNLVLLSLYGLPYPIYISDRSEPGKDLGRFQNFLRNALYPKSTGYIAQTEAAKKICLEKGWNENIEVIGNPIRDIQQNGSVEKENIILTVGRLIKTKHVDHLIRIFAEIGDPDWKLMIVGGDAKKLNLSKELKELACVLNADKNILLEGEQSNIERYYKRSKIFAFTSSSEGFPNVVGEALSAGLPVVAYDCIAGPSDLIRHGENGYLIPLFDREEFKDKLKKLMYDHKLRNEFGKKAELYIKEYKVSHIADKFYNFITNKLNF